MKNKIIISVISLLMCFILAISVSASEGPSKLVIDETGALTQKEADDLSQKLSEISNSYNIDVAVALVSDFNITFAEYEAWEIFDNAGLGRGDTEDGILLYVNIAKRDWYIAKSGRASEAISNDTAEEIGNDISSDLSEGEYYSAFSEFADQCDYYINGMINGFPYDFTLGIIASLGIGLIIAFIVTAIMKKKLKTVVKQANATFYTREGSLNILGSRDLYLYSTVSRVRRQNNSSSSSSGSSRSGVGGKF